MKLIANFFFVVALIMLWYALLSAWPAIRAVVTPTAPAPVAVVATNLVPPAPSIPPAPTQPSAQSAPAPGVPMREAVLHVDTAESVVVRDYKFAQDPVMVLERPGGRPLIPPSLNRAPLVLARGTRLGRLGEEQDGWVRIASPSRQIGWVPGTMLTDSRPWTDDD